jgi:hypothetical protein
MSHAISAQTAPVRAYRQRQVWRSISIGRSVIVLAAVGGLAAALLAQDSATAAQAASVSGPDLTRLLRAMAGIKAALALGAAFAVWWRLAVPAGAIRLAAYAAACAAMAAGPGLIWQMVHVAAGAALLHGGLAAAIILLWRDPAMHARLAMLVAARKHA